VAAALAYSAPSHAVDLRIAVAANFRVTADALLKHFTQRSGYSGTLSSGSTGQLYAQIRQGAPFDVFLAADADRPRLLESQGLAVPGTAFTYAVGKLVLWSPGRDLSEDPTALLEGNFRHLALANPDTAPYGAAARQVLQHLGLWSKLRSRVVQGQDVGQTYQFIATGNAELGFVALSQLRLAGQVSPRHCWVVPQRLYRPLEQQAVLLKRARDHAAARSFLEFLRGERARDLIRRDGYGTP
jgi:molybdate transport system substrate-binding protein